MTRKQLRFVEEYLHDLNGTQAYLRAGYKCTEEVARRNASRLLTDADVQAAVAERMANRSVRTEVTQDKVLREIARVAFSDIRTLFDGNRLRSVHELSDDEAAAVASIKVVVRPIGDGEVEYIYEIKMWPKAPALDMAGRHLGLFSKDNNQQRPLLIIKDLSGDPLPS